MAKPNRKSSQKVHAARHAFVMRRAVWLVAAVVVLGGGIFQASGLSDFYDMKQEQAKLHRDILELEQETAGLQEEIHRLQHDPTALEALAREQLGLVRDGEVVYQLVQQK